MATQGVPEQMTAVQVVEFNKPYESRRVPTPTDLGEYEMLLKTATASFCHTDTMVIKAAFPTKLPCTASHEGTGVAVALGSKVRNFKVGDRIMTGLPKGPCGTCSNCQGPDDWRQYCENIEGHIGIFVDGAFADYHVADCRNSCHIPDNVSFSDAAPLACAGITIYRAIAVSQAKSGDWLAFVGAGGGLGHLGIQFALAKGIQVIAIEARDEGMELCKKSGAKHILDVREGRDKLVEDVKALTGGSGAFAAINVSAHESAATLACAVTRMHGTMVQVAAPTNISVEFEQLLFRDVRIQGSLIAGQEVSQQMLNDVSTFGIHIEKNLVYGLEQVPDLVKLAHSGKMKGKAICVVDKELEEGTAKK
ncbi:hypothetical protein A1O7_01816 [Cladophialophora yegresii CBS 114405]|uniref:Enoyl reductase (ER) domain-containing protein n=1 Tax=Cladophialophora yegresii CBS 114405 TaxID=1182544 RepID=W9WKF6_9EURO|nr:uncharacterized protein A1O7_01816 [Cladophialophora yegresii CBS 114405]EXJ65475.1 hypothetical protein A1O7_01816 [Cladophialophora yegresii CBS 114405]